MSRHYLLSERNGPAGPAPMVHKNGNGEQERMSGTGDNKNGGDEKIAK